MSEYMGWCAVGEFAGNMIALLMPKNIISPSNLGHIFAAFFGGLAALGVFRKFKSQEGVSLKRQLLDIDRLFFDNTITEEERANLRNECIKGFKKKLGA
jgi:hypothetical protein